MATSTKQLIPDVLAPGLDVVFCGTAPSPVSFRERAYYANPGNAFWPTLHKVGLLPGRLDPKRHAEVVAHGIGLTDLNKTEYGSDHELSAAAIDPEGVRERLRRCRPAAVAFTSKNAGALFFDVRAIGYGRQPASIVATLRDRVLENVVWFVLSSPSGRARSFWTIEPWQTVADFVRARRTERGEA